jgi:hypothetical protein
MPSLSALSEIYSNMFAGSLSLALWVTFALPFTAAQCGGGGGGNPVDPWEPPRSIWPEDCINRPIQCCDTVVEPANPSATVVLGLFNISPQGLNGYVGLNCSPVTVIGVTNGNWYAMASVSRRLPSDIPLNSGAIPVCCSDNTRGTSSQGNRIRMAPYTRS